MGITGDKLIAARGGEDYQFDGLSVKVVPSLPGVLGRRPFLASALFPANDYTGRLLRALGYPRLVLPTHWDRFNVTFEVSQEPALERVQSFVAEVKAASPKSRVIVPKYFESIAIP